MARIKSKKADDVKKIIMAFSVSKREKRLIAESADKMGLSMSAYIRYMLLYGKEDE